MRGIWRVLGLALVGPLSLGTVVPSIQWCALDWSQVTVACFAECTARPHRACAGEQSRAGTGGSCTAVVCDAPPPCMPPPSDGTCAGEMACAVEVPAGDPPATPQATSPGAGRDPSGRAFCLDDPAGTTSPRPAPSIELDPTALAAVLPALGDLDRPAASRPIHPPRESARPPTRAWTPVPPARAPPGERST